MQFTTDTTGTQEARQQIQLRVRGMLQEQMVPGEKMVLVLLAGVVARLSVEHSGSIRVYCWSVRREGVLDEAPRTGVSTSLATACEAAGRAAGEVARLED